MASLVMRCPPGGSLGRQCPSGTVLAWRCSEGDPCAHCEGSTPRTMTLTVTGIPTMCECLGCPGGTNTRSTLTDINGAYTLTQVEGNPCRWESELFAYTWTVEMSGTFLPCDYSAPYTVNATAKWAYAVPGGLSIWRSSVYGPYLSAVPTLGECSGGEYTNAYCHCCEGDGEPPCDPPSGGNMGGGTFTVEPG